MRTGISIRAIFASVLATLLLSSVAGAQTPNPTGPVTFIRRNLGGPRLGLTIIPGNSELYGKLDEAGMGRTVSQFGWHFEYQVIPEGGGPQFVVEIVPLIGGVEYGKVMPSTSLIMGIRFPSGLEFGMGPNLLGTDEGVKSSLVLAIGKTIDYGGVSIPLNIAFTTSPAGRRISFIFGYAIAR